MGSISLTPAIVTQVTRRTIQPRWFLYINGTDYSSYLKSQSIQASKDYGVQSATITLHNSDGRFSSGGSNEIKSGDVVDLNCAYEGGGITFDKFYGIVNQPTVSKSSSDKSITITCLDYISKLKYTDIELDLEGDKVEVTEETLTPNYLPAPNDTFAQVFNFANDSIAQNPAPIILIRNITANTDDPQDGNYEISYSEGQLKLGAPINMDNYQIVCRSYYHYIDGIYIEDAIEEVIKAEMSYNTFLFGETSAANVVSNHLRDTFYNVEKANYDVLTYNDSESTFTLKFTLAETYDPDTSGGTPTYITITEGTDAFPTSGTATLSGDTFTWTGKTATTLTGIPTSGENALNYHAAGSRIKYEATYAVGQVWYTTYNNIITDLVAGDFSVGGGGVFRYFDKRAGRLILDSAISIGSTMRCTNNYTFSTLQHLGIEINGIKFRKREVENRFDAIEKIMAYTDPNQIIMTRGDNKIWLRTLAQKTVADYNLTLAQSLNYLADEDLYTRVNFYGKNINPSNIMFNEDVDFVTTGQTYKGLASAAELTYMSTSEGWHEYDSSLTDAGYIALERFKPIVYINGIQVDDTAALVSLTSVKIELTEKTVTKTQSSGKGTKVSTSTYYYYKVYMPHQSLDPNNVIIFYDTNGEIVTTIAANDADVDYARGIWTVPGSKKNEDIEKISTATYYVFYGTDSIDIDYDNVKLFVRSNTLPDPDKALVEMTFEYYTVMTSQVGIQYVIDGRYDTQVQTEFYTEPPTGYPYAIVDLGAEYNVQAIDIITGFFKPDEYRKINVNMKITLKYSTDNVTYYSISDETTSVPLASGESLSLEEDALGVDFSARYIMLVLEYVEKIEYKKGCWPVAFTEIAAYDNIVISSEATLIPASYTTTAFINGSDTDIVIANTTGFDSSGTGYISNGYGMDTFTYTSKTSTRLQNVQFDSGHTTSYGTNVRVASELAGDTTVYDDFSLLPQLGDRLYKKSYVDEGVLFTQARLDSLAKAYLKEFIKNHTRIEASILFSPYIEIGSTIYVQDTYNNVATNYFVEEINYNVNSGMSVMSLILARYPANY